eukprot:1160620-Pelagomonas_calceolata.AAC.3
MSGNTGRIAQLFSCAYSSSFVPAVMWVRWSSSGCSGAGSLAVGAVGAGGLPVGAGGPITATHVDYAFSVNLRWCRRVRNLQRLSKLSSVYHAP